VKKIIYLKQNHVQPSVVRQKWVREEQRAVEERARPFHSAADEDDNQI
jgi:hypothetical protein